MALKLVATAGNQTVTLPPGRVLLVGRAVACDLPLLDPTVSRRHAELRLVEGGVAVRDLGSTNGTYVNGARIEEAEARPGDHLSFGRSGFEVREEQAQSAELPAEPAEAALDATVLRRMPVPGPVDIAARVAAEPPERSLVRVGGGSLEERQGKRLALLLDIAKELSGQPDLDHLLAQVVDLTFQVMEVDRVAIELLGEGDVLVPRAARSRVDGGEPFKVPRAIAQEVLGEGMALLVENEAPRNGRFTMSTAVAPRLGAKSALCAPLPGRQGAPLGLIYLENLTAPRPFGDEDLEFLTSFAGMIAVAIENSLLIERARREAVVLSNFQRYFAPELAAEIAGEEKAIRLGGTRRRAVVLFSDIRGFTAISEELPPDQIARLLNDYFTEMVEIVFEHGGALDKFMGDALMAIWGAPLAHPDDADRAVQAAIAMQRKLHELNRRWAEEGRRPLEVGIGVNAGEVFAGNIGSHRRLEYTVLGDAVNTAALLCSQAGPGEILIAEALCRTLETPPMLTPLAPLPLKSKAQAVPVYRVEW